MKDELYDVVEHTIDYAFQGRYMLDMYEYLRSSKASRTVVEEFLMSCTATEVKNLVLDLEGYLEGGSQRRSRKWQFQRENHRTKYVGIYDTGCRPWQVVWLVN